MEPETSKQERRTQHEMLPHSSKRHYHHVLTGELKRRT